MADKGMTDFLSYNIYLTRWKEKEVLNSECSQDVKTTVPQCFPSARQLTSAFTTRQKMTP